MVLRISLGSFDYGPSYVMDEFRNNSFWTIWLIQVTVLKVVFLNFIIAEVTNSYTNIMQILDPTILQERASLINDSEDMLRAKFGKKIATWHHLFPKYIITRETDS